MFIREESRLKPRRYITMDLDNFPNMIIGRHQGSNKKALRAPKIPLGVPQGHTPSTESNG